MSANFENKKVVVSEIENLAKDAKSIVLVDYRGLSVAHATALRTKLEMLVVFTKFTKTDS